MMIIIGIITTVTKFIENDRRLGGPLSITLLTEMLSTAI